MRDAAYPAFATLIELRGCSWPVDPFAASPELEQTVRRILDDHMERAWQEIRLAIRAELDKS